VVLGWLFPVGFVVALCSFFPRYFFFDDVFLLLLVCALCGTVAFGPSDDLPFFNLFIPRRVWFLFFEFFFYVPLSVYVDDMVIMMTDGLFLLDFSCLYFCLDLLMPRLV